MCFSLALPFLISYLIFIIFSTVVSCYLFRWVRWSPLDRSNTDLDGQDHPSAVAGVGIDWLDWCECCPCFEVNQLRAAALKEMVVTEEHIQKDTSYF